MTYKVNVTAKAREDIKRLYAYMLERDEETAERAYDAITKAMEFLEEFPFSCRKASSDKSFLRELIVPFGSSGYVVLFSIKNNGTVTVAAVRHQREDDYH